MLHLAREAEHSNITGSDSAEESRRWVREADGFGLGMSPEALGPRDFLERIPIRDFGASAMREAHDRRTDWLRAPSKGRTIPARRATALCDVTRH
ncbi:hypothetical protein [Streptomyces sp. NPDC005374]|uniref:hypothetical protein n=1 Tax=Streptomyces sp. NPDC005374 TaxID=3364713 RepID=UPI0036A7F060